MGFELPASGDLNPRPCPVGTHHPESARAAALAQARVALAAATLSTAEGIAACLRVLEVFVHRRRLVRRALLLERPMPKCIESQFEALHTQAGCQQDPVVGRTEGSPGLPGALAQLPWSGEWLIVVVDRIADAGVADDLRRVGARWVAARNAFVEAHAGLVRHVVKRHGWSGGVPREDVIQEAYLALCRAVERFDTDRGARFSSYAVPVIRHAIAQYMFRMGSGPRALSPIRPTAGGASPPHTLPRNGAGRFRPPAVLSLDAPFEDGESLAERLADTETPGPDLATARMLERERLRNALRDLTAEVAEIVMLRWGLDGSACRTVHAIARQLARTPAEVRVIIQDALGFLRNRVTAASGGHGIAGFSGDRRPPAAWAAPPAAPPRGAPRVAWEPS